MRAPGGGEGGGGYCARVGEEGDELLQRGNAAQVGVHVERQQLGLAPAGSTVEQSPLGAEEHPHGDAGCWTALSDTSKQPELAPDPSNRRTRVQPDWVRR